MGIKQLNGAGQHSGRGLENLDQTLIGGSRLASTAQHDGISRLKAQRHCVHSDVWPGLIDDADHAQGHPHFADSQAVGPGPLRQDFPYRIGQGTDRAYRLFHFGDARQREQQAVTTRGIEVARREVHRIRRQNLVKMAMDLRRHGRQDRVFLAGRETAHLRRRPAGRL